MYFKMSLLCTFNFYHLLKTKLGHERWLERILAALLEDRSSVPQHPC